MEYTLTMTFLTTTGEKVNLSISDVRSDVTKEEALALMDSIIEQDIFASSKGGFVSKSAAYVTSREVTKFSLN